MNTLLTKEQQGVGRKMSNLEQEFYYQLLTHHLIPADVPGAVSAADNRVSCVREFPFHPVRKWRFDFAWPVVRVAVEIEGGTFISGAHTRGVHFSSDCEKYAEALLLGWKVLRVDSRMVKDGRALLWVKKLLQD